MDLPFIPLVNMQLIDFLTVWFVNLFLFLIRCYIYNKNKSVLRFLGFY